VLLFFVLSSYLLSSQFINWNYKNYFKWNYYAAYLLSRFLRIYPLFFIVTLTWACIGKQYGVNSTSITFSNLFEILTLQTANGYLWTIPVEFKAYFILPFVWFIVSVVLIGNKALAFIFLLSCYCLGFIFSYDCRPCTYLTAFISYFIMGCIAALITNICIVNKVYENRASRILINMIGGISLVVVSLLTGPGNSLLMCVQIIDAKAFSAIEHYVRTYSSVVFGALLCSCADEKLLAAKIFSTDIMVFLGNISYSLYLWHICVYIIFSVKFPECLNAVIACSIIVSYVSYLLIETPCSKLSTAMKERLHKYG